MEIFINELSLEGQFYSEADFLQAVKEFVRIFSLISERRINAYRNELVFLNKELIRNENFQASFEKIKDKGFKEAFKSIIFNKTNPRDWKPEQIHSADDIFECKLLQNSFVTDTSLAEIAERNLQNGMIRRLLVNFLNSSFSQSQIVCVFKNEIQQIDIEGIDNKPDFENWLGVTQTIADQFLRNPTKFRRTDRHYQGKPIFCEIETAYYWYLDNFHKNEFEVFNSRGEHLGVANLQGVIDYSQQVEGRRINL